MEKIRLIKDKSTGFLKIKVDNDINSFIVVLNDQYSLNREFEQILFKNILKIY